MKKMMMMILSLGFVGTTAMAFEGAFVPALDGNASVQPLKGTCSAEPTPGGNYCKPVGNSCPAGYDQFAKLCWGGLKKGFHKCGISCKPTSQCSWNHTGDYRCSRSLEHAGDRAHNLSAVSGALQLNAEGGVDLLKAKRTCEDMDPSEAYEGQTCTPADGNTCYAPYKRMAKYCFGGWKRPLYKCGIVCSVPRKPTQN
ncbi:hypothetical protein [Bdellovibrio sp. KM01]|uniref:hypothetical protein n=1 Tax=Bdellovibrio sp. KM01 TaxID=2748865 RepID=UPI0015EAA14A|nr:hypothetical protein [Bdellovibrio sp. KM01]QLY26936.1 hypothetical protein HW988_08060 [Bdellovibrio sp. KM01]